MRHDSQYPLRQAHYVSHSTDFANRALFKTLGTHRFLRDDDQRVNVIGGELVRKSRPWRVRLLSCGGFRLATAR